MSCADVIITHKVIIKQVVKIFFMIVNSLVVDRCSVLDLPECGGKFHWAKIREFIYKYVCCGKKNDLKRNMTAEINKF